MKTKAQELSELPRQELVMMLSITSEYKPDLMLAASFRIIELEHELIRTKAKLAALEEYVAQRI
jgi:SAM-dependent MidA family methyltransferase